jgi:hypothetical protein
MFGVKGCEGRALGRGRRVLHAAFDSEAVADLVFVGSMDWMPNSDGMLYFMREILPLIRAKRQNCSVAIVGRQPGRRSERWRSATRWFK